MAQVTLSYNQPPITLQPFDVAVCAESYSGTQSTLYVRNISHTDEATMNASAGESNWNNQQLPANTTTPWSQQGDFGGGEITVENLSPTTAAIQVWLTGSAS